MHTKATGHAHVDGGTDEMLQNPKKVVHLLSPNPPFHFFDEVGLMRCVGPIKGYASLFDARRNEMYQRQFVTSHQSM